jgi:peptidoglycan hydrolase-like protein with peptidoglycan-binding domain
MATPPTIQEGSTGNDVKWAQYLLTRITLSYTQIDGTFGAITKTAVEKFQTDKKLSVDGIVGPKTWAALGGDSAEPPTLANGSTGSVVEKLQEALNKGRGTFAPSSNPVLTVDGKYGANTETAVKGTQKEAKLGVDGVVGLATWAIPVQSGGDALANLCGVRAPGTSS